MSARKAAPEVVKRTGRVVYVTVGAATARLRPRPGFILAGAQRCGTTSLFRALLAHPQVVRPTFHKGINYFDLNYYRGERWYRGHFPVTAGARRRAAGYGSPAVFEASGYYLYHPFAAERIARDLPGVKLVVMLRDPVERAFSAYKHERARGYETEDFERALELEDARLAGEIDRMRDDLRYESFPHRHHSYRHRGQYAEQLARLLEHVPASQLHVIESESFFASPAVEYQRLVEFLRLAAFQPATFDRYNARPGAGLADTTRRALAEHYRPHDERLAALLGHKPGWMP
ncbi:MAG TPA: sulfotransferase domain-containing protein [Streptosporangiaceae bacterium]